MEENYEWFIERGMILDKYSDEFFKECFVKGFDRLISNATELLEIEYNNYYEGSKKGKSFKERIAKEERIESLKNYIEQRKELKKDLPKLMDFLRWGDYQKIERMGFERFVELYATY